VRKGAYPLEFKGDLDRESQDLPMRTRRPA
jgi:hypothetical protein